MSQPWETVEVKCSHCGRGIKVPAARRRRAWRLGQQLFDFCDRKCNAQFVAQRGAAAQAAIVQKTIQP